MHAIFFQNIYIEEKRGVTPVQILELMYTFHTLKMCT